MPVCQAMAEYDQGNYSRAMELLYPVRYRMVEVGGSDAQVRSTEQGLAATMKQSHSLEAWLSLDIWSYCIVCFWVKQNSPLLWNVPEVKNTNA